MGDRYLAITSGSVNWNSTSSWSATDGGASGAAVPIAGDNVYILHGNASIDSGLDQSLVALGVVKVLFNGTIGTSSAPLRVASVSNGSTWDNATGFLEVGAIARFTILGTGGGSLTFTGGSLYYIADGLYIADGVVNVAAAVTRWNIYLLSGQLNIEAGSATASASNTTIQGGFATIKRGNGGGNLFVYGGVCSFGFPGSTQTTATAYVYPGAVLYYISSGTIGYCEVSQNGIASASGNASTFTVTNSGLWGNGQMFEDAINPPTYTNPTVLYGRTQ